MVGRPLTSTGRGSDVMLACSGGSGPLTELSHSLDWVLILLGLALCLPSTSESSITVFRSFFCVKFLLSIMVLAVDVVD